MDFWSNFREGYEKAGKLFRYAKEDFANGHIMSGLNNGLTGVLSSTANTFTLGGSNALSKTIHERLKDYFTNEVKSVEAISSSELDSGKKTVLSAAMSSAAAVNPIVRKSMLPGLHSADEHWTESLLGNHWTESQDEPKFTLSELKLAVDMLDTVDSRDSLKLISCFHTYGIMTEDEYSRCLASLKVDGKKEELDDIFFNSPKFDKWEAEIKDTIKQGTGLTSEMLKSYRDRQRSEILAEYPGPENNVQAKEAENTVSSDIEAAALSSMFSSSEKSAGAAAGKNMFAMRNTDAMDSMLNTTYGPTQSVIQTKKSGSGFVPGSPEAVKFAFTGLMALGSKDSDKIISFLKQIDSGVREQAGITDEMLERYSEESKRHAVLDSLLPNETTQDDMMSPSLV